MAITPATLRLARHLRVTVGREVDAVTRGQVEAWVRAWDEMKIEMSAAVDDLLLMGDGEWPTRAQVNRATRAQAALAHAQERLGQLAETTRATVTDAAGRAVELGSDAQPGIITSQLPPSAGNAAALSASFDRVSTQAIDAIVARSTGQITALTKPLSDEATEAMRRSLIRGVSVGENPRVAARNMLRRLEGDFNGGGLNRALVIARTEIIDAHRQGSAAQQRANADVLGGWTWAAQLDSRTCPSCWAQHGSEHPLDADGPLDHQQGRCARLPRTKTWRELGFDLPEPPSVLPDAQATFWALPDEDRLRIMGPERIAALNSGRTTWAGLSQRRTTDGWRDSFAPAPVRSLVA